MGQFVKGLKSGLFGQCGLGQNDMAGRGILAKMPAPRAPPAAQRLVGKTWGPFDISNFSFLRGGS